jgi:hypothetical protein
MIGKPMSWKLLGPRAGERLIWATLAVAALPTLLQVQPIALARAVHDAVTMAEVSDVEAQRSVNGPIADYAKQLERLLPIDSCVQFVFPHIEPNQGQRPYVAALAGVLVHALYPRDIRVITYAHEGLTGPACSQRHRYILIWIEPAFPETADPSTIELKAMDRLANAVRMSTHADDQGNAGYLFEVKD